ncbi:MAG: hypothetical protein D8M58_05655 [Calditrichaeota bacterium]|nr:MAG: hypothetical protein DWQ03_20850 [Calditrichota bacterium]MBL1204862.1 hypothetical protein [Calditrichota bacterium]NOG44691.1 hypothetical protein [Calditrichota bacterium]
MDIFLIIISCSPSKKLYDTIKSPSPHLQISLNKKSYLKGEPIWIDFKFENKGTKFLVVSSKNLSVLYNQHTLVSNIVDKNGNTYPSGLWGCYTHTKWDTLFPGEVTKYSFNLLEKHYKIPEKYTDRILPPNTYSIFSVVLRNVISNQIIFDVIEPEGIDRIKYDLYQKGTRAFHNLPKMHDIYKELFKIDSNSFYSELLLYKLIIHTSFHDDKEASELAKLFLQRYPNSNYKNQVLRKI